MYYVILRLQNKINPTPAITNAGYDKKLSLLDLLDLKFKWPFSIDKNNKRKNHALILDI